MAVVNVRWPQLLHRFCRYVFLSVGLAALGYFIGVMVRASAGLDPWSVLSMGLTFHFPITFGRSSQLQGVVIIAIAWMLGRAPTLATLLNMYLVGAAYDAFDRWGWLPAPAGTVWESALLLAVAVLGMSFAGTWYMHANLGAGPRDSLFLALVERTGFRISVVQWGLLAIATLIGVLLGGPVGAGTVVAVVATGPCQEIWFRLFGWIARQPWSFRIVQDPVRRRPGEGAATPARARRGAPGPSPGA